MDKIIWTPDLAVGIHIIDEQHKELFARMDQLWQIMNNREISYSEFLRLVKFLEDYSVMHFAAEEIRMLQNSYPYYEEHKKEHRDFMNELKELKIIQFYSHEEMELLKQRLKKNVIDWFFNHISKVDTLLGKFLK